MTLSRFGDTAPWVFQDSRADGRRAPDCKAMSPASKMPCCVDQVILPPFHGIAVGAVCDAAPAIGQEATGWGWKWLAKWWQRCRETRTGDFSCFALQPGVEIIRTNKEHGPHDQLLPPGSSSLSAT